MSGNDPKILVAAVKSYVPVLSGLLAAWSIMADDESTDKLALLRIQEAVALQADSLARLAESGINQITVQECTHPIENRSIEKCTMGGSVDWECKLCGHIEQLS